jgi:hypothetical protein
MVRGRGRGERVGRVDLGACCVLALGEAVEAL